MRRLLGAILLCVALTVALPAGAAAQKDSSQPKALWQEFPLEPAATPAPEATAAAAEPAARPPTAAPRPDADGSSPATLVALLAAVLGLGALARYTIRRRTADARTGAVAAAQRLPATDAKTRARRSAAPAPTRPSGPPARTRPSGPPAHARQRVAPTRYSAAADAEWEECRIKLHSRTIKSHFYAVPYEGGPVLARSPYFEDKRGDGAQAMSATIALHSLVDELTRHGWRQSGTGRSPWDLRFEHAPVAQSRRA